jgi:glycosyltransferase involved in cell wall biosynthesis
VTARGKTPVLFVNSPAKPGADTFIHTMLMRGLDRSRFEVHVACTAGTPGARTPGYEQVAAIPDLHIRPANFGRTFLGASAMGKVARALDGFPVVASLLGLAAYARRHGIRIVHSTDRPRDALSCALLARLTGAKSVIHVHVGFGQWMKRSVKWSMGKADALVGVSQFVARTLVAAGYAEQRTHAVLNAIDAGDWDHRRDPAVARRELGLPEGVPVIACVARLFEGKGQGQLVRALAAARKELPDARLLIVGADDEMANERRRSFSSDLRELVQELGVAQQVQLTGFRKDIAGVLAACDVFALPSFEEPFGLVFLEAMAMRKPVIALDSGGAPEVVEHGKSGLLSQPRDLEALTANLITLLSDPALRARMGDYGRAQVETRFTPRKMAADMEQVYDGLLRS